MTNKEYKELITLQTKYIQDLEDLQTHLSNVASYFLELFKGYKLIKTKRTELRAYIGYGHADESDDWACFLSNNHLEFSIEHLSIDNVAHREAVDLIHETMSENIFDYLEPNWKPEVHEQVIAIVAAKNEADKAKKNAKAAVKKDQEELDRLEAECERLKKKIKGYSKN